MQGQRGQSRVSSLLMRRKIKLPLPPQTLLICPKRFQENDPPNFLNIKVQHQGHLVSACFIQVKMYNKCIVLDMMGRGFPVFWQYTHSTNPHLLQDYLIHTPGGSDPPQQIPGEGLG